MKDQMEGRAKRKGQWLTRTALRMTMACIYMHGLIIIKKREC